VKFRPLEGDDVQTWDALKVLHVEASHIEAEMECRSSDHKVLEGDDVAHCALLALDTSGKLCDLE
jgi:hypothetical protein